ncbi:MAG: ABC transporter ATP-binding protein [Steroidobacteraceae bacterium]
MQTIIRQQRDEPVISLRGVTVGYDGQTVQNRVSFDVRRGSIFAIMGASGAGKSTVLQSMIGLLRPQSGTIRVEGQDYWALGIRERARLGRRFGVLFQSGALWSSLTVGENVALPLQMLTRMSKPTIRRLVELKLALVGLNDAAELTPAQLSGGMRKRAGLARALALDPEVLFLDEPSSGLDPAAARRLDDLIVDLREALGVTVVMVSHDLLSLFEIADDGVFLDATRATAIAFGSPAQLRDHSEDPGIRQFMRREQPVSPAESLQELPWQAQALV